MIKDHKKFRNDFTKILNSYSDEEVLEWIEMDRKRMALTEEENGAFGTFQTSAKPRKATVKLNGASRRTAKLNVVHAEA